ncbi:unnamed protein product [Caenorhabditis brenneri]
MLETNIPVVTGDLGSIYIQRDPKHFRLILNFLRHGSVRVPGSKKLIEEIREEAEFYLLFELIDLCDAKLTAIDEKEKQSSPFGYLLSYWVKRIGNEYLQVERDVESFQSFFMQLLS